MSIEDDRDLEGLSRAGKVVSRTLEEVRHHVQPGVTTAYLDDVALGGFQKFGARSAPKLVYGIPATILISVNDEIVHGTPSNYEIEPGDLVKVDVTAELDGYMADAAITIPVPPVSPSTRKLCWCASTALKNALSVARSDRYVSVIGRAIESEVRRQRFSVIEGLYGHTIHEDPLVRNYYDPQDKQKLSKGLVLTIEPMITTGSGKTKEEADGWTVRTADSLTSAHYEHTVVVRPGEAEILTTFRYIEEVLKELPYKHIDEVVYG